MLDRTSSSSSSHCSMQRRCRYYRFISCLYGNFHLLPHNRTAIWIGVFFLILEIHWWCCCDHPNTVCTHDRWSNSNNNKFISVIVKLEFFCYTSFIYSLLFSLKTSNGRAPIKIAFQCIEREPHSYYFTRWYNSSLYKMHFDAFDLSTNEHIRCHSLIHKARYFCHAHTSLASGQPMKSKTQWKCVRKFCFWFSHKKKKLMLSEHWKQSRRQYYGFQWVKKISSEQIWRWSELEL